MADNFMKRLLLVIAYLIGSAMLIHLMMATDPGYGRNWLYIFTGQIVWIVALILKIALGCGLAWLAVRAFRGASEAIGQARADEEERSEQENANTRNSEELALYQVQKRRREAAESERQAKEKREHEERRRKLEFERIGPRDEQAAIAKALSQIKFGGFE